MNVQFMEVFQQSSKGCSLGHLGEGVDILGEALAAITKLTIRAWNISVGIVDVTRQQYASMHLAPVGTHLLAILTAGIEIGHLVGPEHIVHILGQLGLKRRHDSKLLAHKNLGEQVLCSSENHCLLSEILNEGALGQELWHIAHLVTGLLGEALTGARKDGGAHEHGHIGQVGDEFLHQREILRTIILGRHMDLQECNVDVTQVIVVTLVRVADEQFTLWIVMLQPIFEGSAYEATSDNSNVNHFV